MALSIRQAFVTATRESFFIVTFVNILSIVKFQLTLLEKTVHVGETKNVRKLLQHFRFSLKPNRLSAAAMDVIPIPKNLIHYRNVEFLLSCASFVRNTVLKFMFYQNV